MDFFLNVPGIVGLIMAAWGLGMYGGVYVNRLLGGISKRHTPVKRLEEGDQRILDKLGSAFDRQQAREAGEGFVQTWGKTWYLVRYGNEYGSPMGFLPKDQSFVQARLLDLSASEGGYTFQKTKKEGSVPFQVQAEDIVRALSEVEISDLLKSEECETTVYPQMGSWYHIQGCDFSMRDDTIGKVYGVSPGFPPWLVETVAGEKIRVHVSAFLREASESDVEEKMVDILQRRRNAEMAKIVRVRGTHEVYLEDMKEVEGDAKEVFYKDVWYYVTYEGELQQALLREIYSLNTGILKNASCTKNEIYLFQGVVVSQAKLIWGKQFFVCKKDIGDPVSLDKCFGTFSRSLGDTPEIQKCKEAQEGRYYCARTMYGSFAVVKVSKAVGGDVIMDLRGAMSDVEFCSLIGEVSPELVESLKVEPILTPSLSVPAESVPEIGAWYFFCREDGGRFIGKLLELDLSKDAGYELFWEDAVGAKGWVDPSCLGLKVAVENVMEEYGYLMLERIGIPSSKKAGCSVPVESLYKKLRDAEKENLRLVEEVESLCKLLHDHAGDKKEVAFEVGALHWIHNEEFFIHNEEFFGVGEIVEVLPVDQGSQRYRVSVEKGSSGWVVRRKNMGAQVRPEDVPQILNEGEKRLREKIEKEVGDIFKGLYWAQIPDMKSLIPVEIKDASLLDTEVEGYKRSIFVSSVVGDEGWFVSRDDVKRQLRVSDFPEIIKYFSRRLRRMDTKAGLSTEKVAEKSEHEMLCEANAKVSMLNSLYKSLIDRVLDGKKHQ